MYSADGNEPPHVHVEHDEKIAKFWLDPVRIQASGGFNRTEITIMLVLRGNTYKSIKEIVEKVGKDRTTVQKVVTKLLKEGFINKRQINLDRGFMFVYKINQDIIERTKNELKAEYEKNLEILENENNKE